NSRVSIVDW
ncbi:putative aspartokinase, partial [Vibrio parahaemolyticus VPTS-2010_2]